MSLLQEIQKAKDRFQEVSSEYNREGMYRAGFAGYSIHNTYDVRELHNAVREQYFKRVETLHDQARGFCNCEGFMPNLAMPALWDGAMQNLY